LTKDRSIKKDYKEVAITGYVNHNSKLNNPRQYFLKQGPLAFLPFDKKKFSFVWSLDKKYYINNTKNLKIIVANKINELLRKKNNFKISKIFSYPIHLNLQKKYYKNNVLILGEGLHSIHPIAGQGFNLVLRDIKKLKKLINKNLKLGLTLKNSYLFKEFCDTRKPENVIFGLGIDLTNSFFKQNKYLDPFKEIIIKNVSKMSSLKKFSKLFSDKGFTI
jgi:2-octaprenyl-6-methoxyphenol hydroxylase